LFGLGAFRIDRKRPVDQLYCFLHVARALHEAGHGDVFGNCLSLMTKFLMSKCQA